MTIRRVVSILFLALLGLAVPFTPSAYAGGPTSLLLTRPGDQRATAAYWDDTVYQAISVSLAVDDERGGRLEAPASVGTDTGPVVGLTWLVHDVSVWRVDQIHLTAADGIWVETWTDMDGSAGVLETDGRWHRPAAAKQLEAALVQAGLIGGRTSRANSPSTGPTRSVDPVPSTDPAPSTISSPPVEVTGGSARRSTGRTVLAALGGLVVGGFVVGAWTARRPRPASLRG